MTVDSDFDFLDTSDWGVPLHGESYLYPFSEDEPRTCPSQRVPFEFCACQNGKIDRTESKQPLGVRLGNFLVRRMNTELAEQKATQCAVLALDPKEKVHLTEFDPDGGAALYRVKYQTLPGEGMFWADVRVSDAQRRHPEAYGTGWQEHQLKTRPSRSVPI